MNILQNEQLNKKIVKIFIIEIKEKKKQKTDNLYKNIICLNKIIKIKQEGNFSAYIKN